jgi:hypothetical protein
MPDPKVRDIPTRLADFAMHTEELDESAMKKKGRGNSLLDSE